MSDKTTLQTATQMIANEKSRADSAEGLLATVRAELAAEKARADTAEGALATAREKIAEGDKFRADSLALSDAQAAIVELTNKLEQSNKLRVDAESPERLRAAVASRVKIEGAARMILGDRYVMDTLDDRTLMCAVIEKLGKPADPKESDDHIKARFMERIDNHAACERSLAAVRIAAQPLIGERADSAEDARRKMEERNRNAWRPSVK